MQKQGFHAFETILAYEIYHTAQAAHLFAWRDAWEVEELPPKADTELKNPSWSQRSIVAKFEE